jgi:hypothetical protein
VAWLSAQAWAGVEAEIDACADRVTFGRERDGLADRVQVAPAFGEAASRLNDVLPPCRYIKSIAWRALSAV